MSDNPYESPTSEPTPPERKRMSGLVLFIAIIFASLGVVILFVA